MVFTSNSTSNIVIYNSITNTLADEKFDSVQPFSFLEFLNYSKSLNNGIVQFTDYQIYLKKWNEVTLVQYNDINSIIRQEFISFLKSITLNYTTAEEKRFLQNIDFENNEDLEVAVPFFTTKIKQVLLYFAEKRDTYAIDLVLAKNKGSIFGVNNYLKTTIIESIFASDRGPEITPTVPLSTVSTQLQVEVEEGYDTFNNYFDLDPFETPEFYFATGERAKYFTANTNVIDPNIFLDYDQAIIDLINSERVVLEQLQQLVVTIDTPDLALLQNYDFINYGERTRENLRLVLNAELIKKFTGTDYYYLSATNTGVVSGLLFESTSPVASLLNVYNPTTLTVPESSIKYERDVGLFFKPTRLSLLQLQTPFGYTLKEEVRDGAIYIFPDPNDYGNISGLTLTDHNSPFNYVQQGDKIQRNISSNNALGNSFVTDNDFTFESYHSLEQNSTVQSVMRGLYNAGVVYSYVSDLYGNIYAGFKQQNTNYIKNFENVLSNSTQVYGLSASTYIPYLSSIKSLLNTGTFANTFSITQQINNTNIDTIYVTRNSIGTFLVWNVIDSSVTALSSAYSNVFAKYPLQSSDIQNKLLNFETFSDTFVITTSSYVIVDYPIFTNGQFYQSPSIPLILTSEVNNKASNVYLNGNELYVAKVTVTDSPILSANNNREFNISLQSYNVNSKQITDYVFASTSDYIYSYNVNTFINVTNVTLAHNKKQDLLNLVITYKDLNNNIFLHSLFLRISNGLVTTINQKVYQPTNSNLTINFYDNSYVPNLFLTTLATTPTINQPNGTITF